MAPAPPWLKLTIDLFLVRSDITSHIIVLYRKKYRFSVAQHNIYLNWYQPKTMRTQPTFLVSSIFKQLKYKIASTWKERYQLNQINLRVHQHSYCCARRCGSISPHIEVAGELATLWQNKLETFWFWPGPSADPHSRVFLNVPLCQYFWVHREIMPTDLFPSKLQLCC